MDRHLVPPPIVERVFRTFKPKENFGVHPGYIKHPNPTESREGLLRIKAILANPDSFIGKRAVVGGWVKTQRKQTKQIVFIELNDGSCQSHLQIVIEDTVPNFADVKLIRTGSCLKITGEFVKSQGSGQAIEVKCLDPVRHAIEINHCHPNQK